MQMRENSEDCEENWLLMKVKTNFDNIELNIKYQKFLNVDLKNIPPGR